jgi:UDP-N-acetylmuramoylalanine--D-glutamate ligase
MKNTMTNKKVLITGVGRYKLGSNNSAARFFVKQGAKVTVTDPKPTRELAAGLKHLKGLKAIYHLGGYRVVDFKSADLIIKNPGTRSLEPFLKIARRKGIEIVTDVGAFMALAPPAPIVGITGTRGKSTTTALLGEMIAVSGCASYVGGNMKVSPLNFLDKLRRDHERGRCAAVTLELSSWLLEGWKKEGIAPAIAVITNIFPDHLNTYPSYAAYVNAKAEIFAAQDKDGVVVLNRDNKETRKLASRCHGRIFWFSRRPFVGRGAFVRGGRIVWRDKKEETVARLSDIGHLAGEHNLENILAAAVAAKLLGIENKAIVKTLRSFKGLPDRQEFVREFHGVRYINDTTATSPDGAVAALRRFGKWQMANGKSARKKLVLIAGGKDKELDFRAMAAEIKKRVKSLILFDGTASDKLIKELKRAGAEFDLVPIVKNMRTAVKLAAGEAKRNDVVLLSPGAASFGLFQNEFDRGAQFVKCVKSL